MSRNISYIESINSDSQPVVDAPLSTTNSTLNIEQNTAIGSMDGTNTDEASVNIVDMTQDTSSDDSPIHVSDLPMLAASTAAMGLPIEPFTQGIQSSLTPTGASVGGNDTNIDTTGNTNTNSNTMNINTNNDESADETKSGDDTSIDINDYTGITVKESDDIDDLLKSKRLLTDKMVDLYQVIYIKQKINIVMTQKNVDYNKKQQQRQKRIAEKERQQCIENDVNYDALCARFVWRCNGCGFRDNSFNDDQCSCCTLYR